jgi:hypothetical protein
MTEPSDCPRPAECVNSETTLEWLLAEAKWKLAKCRLEAEMRTPKPWIG